VTSAPAERRLLPVLTEVIGTLTFGGNSGRFSAGERSLCILDGNLVIGRVELGDDSAFG
jgi:hypothetical protein